MTLLAIQPITLIQTNFHVKIFVFIKLVFCEMAHNYGLV